MKVGDWAVADIQASAIAERHGRVFWHSTLMTGFWVLFKTQLGQSDGLVRTLTDMLWSGTAGMRRRPSVDVRRLYYTILVVFVVWGCIALNLAQPLTLVVIGANVAGVNFVFLSIHTLVVNRRVLPRELRPPIWREAVVALCASVFRRVRRGDARHQFIEGHMAPALILARPEHRRPSAARQAPAAPRRVRLHRRRRRR